MKRRKQGWEGMEDKRRGGSREEKGWRINKNDREKERQAKEEREKESHKEIRTT